MPPVPELNFDALTAPIPGDLPGGTRMPFTLRQKLEASRKDSERDPDDPNAAPIPKKPDWIGIIRTAVETLSQTSKDLETALRLTEALTKYSGMAGLREGFKVLRALVENCWDYLHPIPDPEDGEGPEIRAERFNWIGDMDAGARFPHTVREVPLFRVGNQLLSLRERTDSFSGKGPVSADDASRAQLATDTTAQEVEEAYQAFLDLDRALTEKLNNQAPGMIGLRQVLDEIRNEVNRLVPAAQSAQPAATGATDAGPTTTTHVGGVTMNIGSVQSREDAYRLIEQVAEALERIEPHSPIPDLLRRALELGRMPFRRLIKELVRDTTNLAQVYREFGIKDEDAPAP